MNKKIIITLTASIILGGSSVFFAIRFHSKKTEFLNVNVIENREQEEEKKKEEKKEDKQEEITVPWLYTWKGEVLSLLMSIAIGFIVFFIILILNGKNLTRGPVVFFSLLFYVLIFALIFESVVFPSLFSLKKFGKKKYSQRFKIFSKNKIIVISVIIVAIIACFCVAFVFYKKRNKHKAKIFKGFLKFLFTIPFCCVKKNVKAEDVSLISGKFFYERSEKDNMID